jgi:DNA protecting protein DprA
MGTSPKRTDEVRKAATKQLPLFADVPVPDPLPQPEPEPQEAPAPAAPPKIDSGFAETLLALSTVNGLGHGSLKALTTRLSGNLSDIWQASAADIEAILSTARTPSAARIAATIRESADQLQAHGHDLREEMEQAGVSVIPCNALPDKLKHIPDDPLYWLFVEGNPAIVTGGGPMVAVVGTRQPSPDGIKAAERVVRVMARYPSLTLVSGLAEGIDEAAHRESLKHRIKNLAFLGHGIGHVFPESTRELRDEIVVQGGAVATEYLPQEKYRRAYFVRRNRLQAAISDLVIPVEAAEKSGTAHTVNFAHEYKRRIIGLRWVGANGILTAIGNFGHVTVDILTDQGTQQLDAIFRELVETLNYDVFAFEQTRKTFLRELNTRRTKPADLERLIEALREAFHQEQPPTDR